jgi:hypothetical protein
MTGVRESEIDGVLCFWVDMGRPASRAHLIFRQGLADEPLPETGWLRLLEHLALLDRETLTRPIEGSTTMLLTTFRAEGSGPVLADRLQTLARWFAEPDFRLLARERGVLQAEAQLRTDPLVRSLTWRYGAVGPGVTSYAEAGAVRATPELLFDRCRQVFNSANALLVLDGPPPTGLTLPLPAGEYLPPSAATRVDRRHAATYVDEVGGLTLSGVVDRTPASDYLPAILERAVHDGLRQRTGGAYGPWSGGVDADDLHAVVGAGSDVTPDMLPIAAEAAFDISLRLAQDGVPRPWLQEALDARLAALAAPEAPFEVALGAARAVLSDRVPKTHEELVEETRTTDPNQVDAAARAFHASLLIGVPETAQVPKSAPLISFPEVEPSGVSPRYRHIDWPAEVTTFAVDGQALEQVHGPAAQRIRTDEVVGVFAWRDGTRQVVARDGSSLEMEPRQWFRGQELTHTLDTVIPAALQVPMPDREVTFRRMALGHKCAVAFGRSANTVPGLSVLVGVVLLLTVLLLLGGHTVVGGVFLLLAAALGAQLWRLHSQHPAASLQEPATPSGALG